MSGCHRSGPRTVAVQTSSRSRRRLIEPGIQCRPSPSALAIHPFMLSKWRKDARDGRLTRTNSSTATRDRSREIAQTAAARARVRGAQRGGRPLKKSHPVLVRSKGDAFAFIETRAPQFGRERALSAVCRHGSPGSMPIGGAASGRRRSRTGCSLDEIERLLHAIASDTAAHAISGDADAGGGTSVGGASRGSCARRGCAPKQCAAIARRRSIHDLLLVIPSPLLRLVRRRPESGVVATSELRR